LVCFLYKTSTHKSGHWSDYANTY